MDIKKIRSKTEELKALFVIAQRVIPFMEELFGFIEETSPILEDINSAIKENMKKMPNATKQLTKVTQATEIASTEIMDTVDRVNNGLYCVIKELGEFKSNQNIMFANPINLLRGLSEAIETEKDLKPFINEINQFIERVESVSQNEHQEIITHIISEVQNISDDANSIINSLQMQDITAQQLAAVNHLLENVQLRLGGIMKYLNESEATSIHDAQTHENMKISKLHRNIAFDPDAIDSMDGGDRQNMVDSLLANPDAVDLTEEVVEDDNTGVDDVINAFQKQTKIEEIVEEEVSEEFSQDDIDALFG